MHDLHTGVDTDGGTLQSCEQVMAVATGLAPRTYLNCLLALSLSYPHQERNYPHSPLGFVRRLHDLHTGMDTDGGTLQSCEQVVVVAIGLVLSP